MSSKRRFRSRSNSEEKTTRSRERSYYKRRRPRSSRRNTSHKRRKQHYRSSTSDSSTGGSAGAYDDTVGAFQGRTGELIDNRFKILQEAGVGTFGRVLECYDTQRKKIVAIKVVRAIRKYTDSAKIEADILNDIMDHDTDNSSLCVRLFKTFQYRGHMCLVFERLGQSLYEYLRDQKYRPYPLQCVRDFTYQLLKSLAYLHDLKLVHTDLKPENILLVEVQPKKENESTSTDSDSKSDASERDSKSKSRSIPALRHRLCSAPTSTLVKLIDFGGATYDHDSKSSIISTRQYRAPEVMLGLKWSFPSDIWSAACIMAELYIGELWFSTHENLEHFALIEKCVGKFPKHMVEAGFEKNHREVRKYFSSRTACLRWPDNASSSRSIRRVKDMATLDGLEKEMDPQMLDLLKKMLTIDPSKRIRAKEALQHPFFASCSPIVLRLQ